MGASIAGDRVIGVGLVLVVMSYRRIVGCWINWPSRRFEDHVYLGAVAHGSCDG